MQSSAESVEVVVNGDYSYNQEYNIQSNKKSVPQLLLPDLPSFVGYITLRIVTPIWIPLVMLFYFFYIHDVLRAR